MTWQLWSEVLPAEGRRPLRIPKAVAIQAPTHAPDTLRSKQEVYDHDRSLP
jgi:hypothetical protein